MASIAHAGNKAKVSEADSALQKGLATAALNCDVDTVKLLLSKGSPTTGIPLSNAYSRYSNSRDKSDEASMNACSTVISLLDTKKFNLNTLEVDDRYMGVVPLIFSLQDWRDLDWYAKRGLDLNKRGRFGETALFYATRDHSVEKGLEDIATKGYPDGDDYEKIQKIKATDLFSYLLEHSNLNLQLNNAITGMSGSYPKKSTSLMVAIIDKKFYTIWWYLSKKPNLKIKDFSGKTALDHAIETANPRIIKLVQSAVDNRLPQFPVGKNVSQ